MRFPFRPPPRCSLHLFMLLVTRIPACGAPNLTAAPTPVETAENSFTWDHVCEATAKRVQRCPKEEKADGPFVRRCMSAVNDRACFETFNRNTMEFLMECIRSTPCGKGSIFENCAKDLFTKETLPAGEQERQVRCRDRMNACKLNFEDRCIAPFLTDPLREQIWTCVEGPCDNIRRCTEGVLETVGCR